jgi:hypothetical protein
MSAAFNPQVRCYGEEQLPADAGTLIDQAAPASTPSSLRKVRIFAGSAQPSDDLAMLALGVGSGYSGNGGHA